MPPTLDGQTELATPWTNTPLLMGQATPYELTQIAGLGLPGVRPNDIDLLSGGVNAARDIIGPRTIEYDIEVNPTGTGSARDTDLAARLSDLLTAWSPWPGNLLSPHQASLEDSTLGASGWAPGTNTTIARSTAQSVHESASLALTAVATDAVGVAAITPQATRAVPVVAGQAYTGLASFRSAATARTARVDVRWWNAAGFSLGDAIGADITTSTSAWTQASITATAPATAAFASLLPRVLNTAAGEVHYVDKASLHPGAGTTWRMPGDVDSDLVYKVIGQANNRKVTGRPRVADWDWDVAMDSSRIAVVTAEFFVPKPEIRDATTGAVVRY